MSEVREACNINICCSGEFRGGSRLSSVTLCLVALRKGHSLNPVSPRDLPDSSQSWDYMLAIYMVAGDLN